MPKTHFVDSPLEVELEAGLHKLCPCGLSQAIPFCDGAHKGTGFKSFKLELAEKTAVLLCRCGKTRSVPYCDGSHG
ncbi:MAG TPA: CDGSH iron-sulfur domain-containing protein [Fibrobacteria bacterium]|nr:CDGSH iron-sulfur domain-containing protein [Fibrobacteria bacterium]HOX52991.1 CDGSH iron-sulfur domain-containing protein [Fibrobacteria bacterium]